MPHCLVMDDSQAVRKIVRTLLEKNTDYTVVEAANGREGYDFCVEQIPDCIFLDNNMPVMDGMDFLQALKNIAGEAKPHIVYSCRELDAVEISAAMEKGATDFIIKPFNSEKLFQKLNIVPNPS